MGLPYRQPYLLKPGRLAAALGLVASAACGPVGPSSNQPLPQGSAASSSGLAPASGSSLYAAQPPAPTALPTSPPTTPTAILPRPAGELMPMGPALPPGEHGFRPGEPEVSMEQVAAEGVRIPDKFRGDWICVRRKVGASPGLLCHGGLESEQTGHSIFLMTLFAIEKGQLRRVFTFPQQARALSFAEAVYATLKVTYDEEQGVLILEDGALPCEEATRSGDESAEYRRVVSRLCQARGTYQLRGATLLRRGPPPTLRWPPRAAPASTEPSGSRLSLP